MSVVLLALVGTGCVTMPGKKPGAQASPTTNYFRNRAMDARDIFTLTGMYGFVGGAKVQLGPVSAGLFAEIGGVGHGTYVSGEVGLLQGEVGSHKAEDITIILGPVATRSLRTNQRRSSLRKKDINESEDLPASAYTRLGVSAAGCVGLRFEFNPGELLDFFLGIFGVDIYEDDIYKNRPAGKTIAPEPARK